jgi:hypothetical protein
MEGFKTLPKGVQCFKEGGAVYKSRHSEKAEVSEDIAKDKKIIKKAVSIHDKQQHEGKKTDLSTLKKGGRAKKEGGCVGRYKAGGTVENAYGSPKTDKDIKDIANTKRQKPKKMQMGGMTGPAAPGPMAAAPSGAMGQGQGVPMTELEKRRMMEKMARAKKYLGPAQQSELIKQSPAAAGLTGGGYKKGGKVKKMNTGGPISQVAQDIIEGKRPAQSTPGQMTPDERRASIGKAFGAGSKKMKDGGKACK